MISDSKILTKHFSIFFVVRMEQFPMWISKKICRDGQRDRNSLDRPALETLHCEMCEGAGP